MTADGGSIEARPSALAKALRGRDYLTKPPVAVLAFTAVTNQ